MAESALRPEVWVPLPSLLRATEPNLILWGPEKVSPAVNYFHTIFSEGPEGSEGISDLEGYWFPGSRVFVTGLLRLL